MTKADAGNAERAAEHYARHVQQCVFTARAIRTKFQRQDLFGSDCIGKREDGTMVFIQVTLGDISSRKQRLEEIPWQNSDIVVLLEVKRLGSKRYFREHYYMRPEWHVLPGWLTIPRSWFKAWKEAG